MKRGLIVVIVTIVRGKMLFPPSLLFLSSVILVFLGVVIIVGSARDDADVLVFLDSIVVIGSTHGVVLLRSSLFFGCPPIWAMATSTTPNPILATNPGPPPKWWRSCCVVVMQVIYATRRGARSDYAHE